MKAVNEGLSPRWRSGAGVAAEQRFGRFQLRQDAGGFGAAAGPFEFVAGGVEVAELAVGAGGQDPQSGVDFWIADFDGEGEAFGGLFGGGLALPARQPDFPAQVVQVRQPPPIAEGGFEAVGNAEAFEGFGHFPQGRVGFGGIVKGDRMFPAVAEVGAELGRAMVGGQRLRVLPAGEMKVANGAGNRGSYLACTYAMNSATVGTGTCRHSNGAQFTMHVGN